MVIAGCVERLEAARYEIGLLSWVPSGPPFQQTESWFLLPSGVRGQFSKRPAPHLLYVACGLFYINRGGGSHINVMADNGLFEPFSFDLLLVFSLDFSCNTDICSFFLQIVKDRPDSTNDSNEPVGALVTSIASFDL